MAAASLLPAAAAANRSTFFHADGSARSLAEVHDLVSRRISKYLAPAAVHTSPAAVHWPAAAGSTLPPAGSALPQNDPALTAARARMAYLVLAAMS
jgi:hypothetical protein